MSDDFSQYESMRVAGYSPEDVYRTAKTNGVDFITRIRLIRAVFSFTPAQAKEVVYRGDGVASSLDEHQERIAAILEPEIEKRLASQSNAPVSPVSGAPSKD